jgi:iron complex outermembrane receptor protein
MRKLLPLLILSLFTSLVTHAQNRVSGTVKDQKNIPLYGATVSVRGTNTKAAVKNDGSFTIDANNGSTLEITFTGYQTKTVVVNGNAVNVILESSENNLQEVVVLGSRSAGRAKLETTAPVDLFDMKALITEVPQTNLTDILNQVAPSFNSTTQTVADGTDHIDPATVRGLGPDQTLVLLNGKRRYTSALVNVNGTMGRGSVGTDLNVIPAAAIDRIELLRDGASAQYGSDAIAGVINVQLKNQINKGTASVSYGGNITTYQAYTHANSGNFVNGIDPVYIKRRATDGGKFQATVNYGWRLGKTPGSFINVTGVFEDRQPTVRSGERTGNIDDRTAGDAASNNLLTALGVTRDHFQMRVGQSKTRNFQGVVNGGLRLKNGSEFYFYGVAGNRNGNSTGFYRMPYQATNIPAIYPRGFLPEITSHINDLSVGAGLKGKWANDWNYDLSTVYGTNKFEFEIENTLNVSAYYNDNKVRQNSFNAGNLQFKQSTTNFDISKAYNNKINLNLAFGAEFRYEQYLQKRGEEASWANYMRRTNGQVDIYNGTPTTVTLADGSTGIPAGGSQVFPGFRPDNEMNQNRTSFALYTDFEFTPFKNLLVDVAGRFENYSDFGSNLSGKIAGRYKISKAMSLRGSASTGFRAPALQQKYLTKTSTVFQGGVAFDDATLPNNSTAAQLLGIPTLKAEISYSASIGATFNFSRFKLTVDGFTTYVKDRILLTDAFTGRNGGTAQEQQIYDILLKNNASRAIFMTNAINLRTSGVDVVATYNAKMPAGQTLKFEWSGTFSNRQTDGSVKSSPLLKGREHLYMSPVNEATLIEGNPQLKSSLSASYRKGKFNVFLRNTYFGKATHVETASLAGSLGTQWFYRQVMSAKVITDLSVGYKLTKAIRLSAGVNNLFDKYSDLLLASKGEYFRLDVNPASATYNQVLEHRTAAQALVANNNGVSSNNQFNYSRRITQIGMNGRYVFGKIELNF